MKQWSSVKAQPLELAFAGNNVRVRSRYLCCRTNRCSIEASAPEKSSPYRSELMSKLQGSNSHRVRPSLLMTLLAFPSATILIVWIARLNLCEAIFTDENPAAIFFDTDSKKSVFLQSAGRTLLLADSFNFPHADSEEMSFG